MRPHWSIRFRMSTNRPSLARRQIGMQKEGRRSRVQSAIEGAAPVEIPKPGTASPT